MLVFAVVISPVVGILTQAPPCAKYMAPSACECAIAPWYVVALGKSDWLA